MKVLTKRIIMSISGVVLCGMSVGMFKHAAFGVDPFQALMSGLDAVIPIRFGTLYVIVNILLLLFPPSDSAAGRFFWSRRLCPCPSLPLSTSRRIWASPLTTPSLWYGASGSAGSHSLSAVF